MFYTCKCGTKDVLAQSQPFSCMPVRGKSLPACTTNYCLCGRHEKITDVDHISVSKNPGCVWFILLLPLLECAPPLPVPTLNVGRLSRWNGLSWLYINCNCSEKMQCCSCSNYNQSVDC